MRLLDIEDYDELFEEDDYDPSGRRFSIDRADYENGMKALKILEQLGISRIDIRMCRTLGDVEAIRRHIKD